PFRILGFFFIKHITATAAYLLFFAPYKGCRCARVGEGCGGRKRSEAAAPVPLKKQTNCGRGGSGSVPRSKPDPAAARSYLTRRSGGTP
ncbi:MAG: hypothetical protein NZM35_12280, partial [Chitinophagales bacterium]|nr:hypothetical protein [Chitinophagales bacterium]